MKKEQISVKNWILLRKNVKIKNFCQTYKKKFTHKNSEFKRGENRQTARLQKPFHCTFKDLIFLRWIVSTCRMPFQLCGLKYLAAGQLSQVRLQLLSDHRVDGHQAEDAGLPHAALSVVVALKQQKERLISTQLKQKRVYLTDDCVNNFWDKADHTAEEIKKIFQYVSKFSLFRYNMKHTSATDTSFISV